MGISQRAILILISLEILAAFNRADQVLTHFLLQASTTHRVLLLPHSPLLLGLLC